MGRDKNGPFSETQCRWKAYITEHNSTNGQAQTKSEWVIIRDQLNSRFHGRDIFREIDLIP